MKYHFNNNGWPASKYGPPPTSEAAKDKLVDDLQVRGVSLPLHLFSFSQHSEGTAPHSDGREGEVELC